MFEVIFEFMDIIVFLIIAILCVGIFILSLKVLRNIAKALFSVLILIMFITVMFTGIAVYDLNNLRKAVAHNVTFVILEEGEPIREVAFKTRNDEDIVVDEDDNESVQGATVFVDIEYLIQEESVTLLDFDVLLEGDDLLAIYDAETTGEIHDVLIRAGDLSAQESQSVLNLLVLEFAEPDDFKKAITVSLLRQRFRTDYNNVVRDLRDEKINIEPEFISIKIINNMPSFLANRLISE